MAVAARGRIPAIRESAVPQLRIVKAEALEARQAAESTTGKLAWVLASVAIGAAIFFAMRAGAKDITDPEQAWFWEPEWLVGEVQAAGALSEGRYRTFGSDEEFERALLGGLIGVA